MINLKLYKIGYDYDATSCCGMPNEQYCCTPNEAAQQQSSPYIEEQINVPYSTCTNYLEYNGIVYGAFNCPVDGYDIEAYLCCGQLNQQFCCTQFEYEEFLNNFNQNATYFDENKQIAEEPIKPIEAISSPDKEIKDKDNTDSNKKDGSVNLNDLSSLYKSFKNSSISNGEGGLVDKAKDLFNMYQTFKNITKKDKRRLLSLLEN